MPRLLQGNRNIARRRWLPAYNRPMPLPVTQAEFNAQFAWIRSHGRLAKEYEENGDYTLLAIVGESTRKVLIAKEAPGDYEAAVVGAVTELRALLEPRGK
jgi:hypothetical protein